MQYISVFNYGVIELAKNHIKWLRKNGITNHTSYVTDKESADELTALGYNVVYINNASATREQSSGAMPKDAFDFGTVDFNNMSYIRYYVIRELLKKGGDVWYMDIDTVVLKDLTPIYNSIKQQGNIDVCFQNDINMPCTGCMLLMSNQRTVQFVQQILDNKTNNTNDQIIAKHVLQQYNNGLKVALFPHYTFPNGVMYFGSDFVNVPEYLKNMKDEYHNATKETYFVHANWMVGDATKTNALKKYGLWL